MSEEEQNIDEEFENIVPQIEAITISLEPGIRPKVDLGRVQPVVAIAVMKSVIEVLESMSDLPDIYFDGIKVFSEDIYSVWDDDEDDE